MTPNMAAVNSDTKRYYPPGRDDSSTEAGIPTGEKIDIDHVERLDTRDSAVVTAGVKASQVYENMAPIAELGLPDWRATEKQLVRRLDMSLMPTIWLVVNFFNQVFTYLISTGYFTSITTSTAPTSPKPV